MIAYGFDSKIKSIRILTNHNVKAKSKPVHILELVFMFVFFDITSLEDKTKCDIFFNITVIL